MIRQMNRHPKPLLPPDSSLVVRILVVTATAMMALLPFHAFLTVWASSLVGHYTAMRLWKEFLLAGLVIGCAMLYLLPARHARMPGLSGLSGTPGLVETWRRLRFSRPTEFWLATLIPIYLLLLAGYGAAAYVAHAVSLKAAAFGVLLDSRFLVFFLVIWLLSIRSDLIVRHWRQILLVPAAVVICFGLLQFSVLPADFLTHFGYGKQTIEAIQTVDQKADYQRIQSTLRGANPLGAYLVLVLAALGSLALRQTGSKQRAGSSRRSYYALAFAAACAALAMTFSRSAWIGTMATCGYLLWNTLRGTRYWRQVVVAGTVGLVIFGTVGIMLRQNDTFQNAFLHTDEHSRSVTSSNQGHFMATTNGLRDVVRQPLGRGPGTAGPASVDNMVAAPRLAENYFVQIAQEVGIFGVGLFVAINCLVARALWLRRSDALAVVLLAALVGISVVNLLSHAWTDDTLSYIWWGLAGAALAIPTVERGSVRNTE